MILKVDSDSENSLFNIIYMELWERNNSEVQYFNQTKIMLFSFNVEDVKYAYTVHEHMDTIPEFLEIIFKDERKLKIYFVNHDDEFKYPEKLLTEIFKMKMLGTKWAEENPEKYI